MLPVAGRMIAYESDLERDYLVTLSFDPDLVRVAAQPVTLPCLAADGRATKYTPDFMVVCGGDRPRGEIVEVKAVEDLRKDWRLLRPRLRAGRDHALSLGLKFRLVSDRWLATWPLPAMRFLMHYLNVPGDQGLEEHLIHRLAGIGPATPQKLLAAAFQSARNQAEAIPHMWKLIASGRIRARFAGGAVTMSTPIWICRDSDWHRTDPYSRKVGLRLRHLEVDHAT